MHIRGHNGICNTGQTVCDLEKVQPICHYYSFIDKTENHVNYILYYITNVHSPYTLLLTAGKIQLRKTLIWHSSLTTLNNDCNTL